MEVSAQSLRDVIGLSAGRAANTERRMEVRGMMDIKWRKLPWGKAHAATGQAASLYHSTPDVGLGLLVRYLKDTSSRGPI